VERALEGGVDAVQLREKDLPGHDFYELARELRTITVKHGALFLINDRVDVAVSLRAHGVHLGAASIPIAEARRMLPPGSLIGWSAHSVEEAEGAALAGADYAFLAPVFAPGRTSVARAPLGAEALRTAAAVCPIPVYALGGVTAERMPELMNRTGSGRPPAGVAVVGAILGAEDPRAAAEALRAALDAPPA